jgi:TM2 domain-containing membrane protein YozV
MESNNEIATATEEFKPQAWRAGLYSAIYPGLGQMYNGDFNRGAFYFVLAFILIITFYLVVPFFIFIIFWIYNIYQAYSYARSFSKVSNKDE